MFQEPSNNSLLHHTGSAMLKVPIQQEHIQLRLQSHFDIKDRGYRIGMTEPLEPKRGDEKERHQRYHSIMRDHIRQMKKQDRSNFRPKSGQTKDTTKVGDILKYFLNDHNLDHQEPTIHFYEQWEVVQLNKQITTLSLGLFVIRLPNPDCPNEQLLKYYSENREDGDQYVATPSEALNLYQQLFVVDSETNINLAQQEKAAFCVAYYILSLTGLIRKRSSLKRQMEPYERFLCLFNYYFKVKNLSVDQYELLRKNDLAITDAEYLLQEPAIVNQIPHLFKEGNLEERNKQFDNIKELVKVKLGNHLIEARSLASDGYQLQDIIIANSSQLGDMINEFPQLMQHIIDQVTKIDPPRMCKLLKGGQLKRVPSKGSVDQFIWQNLGGRPRDLLTLFRNVITYKLTRRANMFVRQFLSKDEHSIMLVVDTLEETLERYAQSNGVFMEVDMGSIDLFSFQPVDSYNRPLRLNNYIRDRPFYEKYQLGVNKGQKDNLRTMQSVESDLSSLYVKATKLNREELRVKIILDQEDLDNAYRWISEKLNIDYIEPQAVLVNQNNDIEVDDSQWEVYYVYIKLVLEYHRRIKSTIEKAKDEPELQKDMLDNLGLIYRLAFCKAMGVCNDIYDKHTTDTFFKKVLSALMGSKLKLKNIWDYLGYSEPTAYCQYFKKKRLERIWRKYEINQKRARSKFVSSQRLYLGNRIIHCFVNMGQGQSMKLITEYFPLHDPYLLKGIRIQPYLKVFVDQGLLPPPKPEHEEDMRVPDIMMQFEGKRCASDFTRESLQQKLQFKVLQPSRYQDIPIEAIKNYSGQKIALYFQFIKFATHNVKYMFIVCLIVQILLWVEESEIQATGTSTLTPANNVILFIFSLINIGWTTQLVERWRHEERSFEEKFGLSGLTEEEEKSNLFRGKFMRNLEDDNLNYEYVPLWKKFLKVSYSTLISVVYAVLVITTVLMVFALKGYLVQTSASESTANAVPALLITLTTLIYNYLYKKISKKLTEFENHKTLSQFESSVVFKQYTIIFVNTFTPLFIYAFLESVLPQVQFCTTKTALNTFVSNCSLQVSNQMLAFALISFGMDLVNAALPYIKFKIREFLKERRQRATKTSFGLNHFEAIDSFFEEQRSMQSFMYNEEIDCTSTNYTDFVVRLTALTLFGPAFPFAYCLLYFNGVVALHTNKFEILMLSRRTMPVKSKRIGIWSTIVQIVGFMGVVVNLCYVIYTRQLVGNYQARLLLGSVLVIFILKFYLSMVYSEPTSATLVLEHRNERNIHKALLGVKRLQSSYVSSAINTDISNVDYTQMNQRRKLPDLPKANVRLRQ